MQYRPQSSSSNASMASSPSYSRGGWAPAQATLSPAACSAVEHDYFAMKRTNSSDSTTSSTTTSSRRDSSSSSSSSVSGMVFSSSPLSPSIAYPCWPVHDTTIASPSRQGSSIAKAIIPPPVRMPTSHITDDELAAIDFSAGRRNSNASTSSAEYDAGAQGISWSQTKQPTVPQREERKRRLPPPPPGMSTVVSGGKRKSASKERRRKGLSMIKE